MKQTLVWHKVVVVGMAQYRLGFVVKVVFRI